MSFLQDRYILVAIAGILMIAVICIVDVPGEQTEGEMVGVVSEVTATEKGNTFVLTDTEGNEIKCFFDERVVDGAVCSVIGRFSDDGDIFFISRLVAR